MANFAWVKLLRELQPAALTVRAQVVSPNDNGRLLWDQYMPRQDVDSVRMMDITTLDTRATADRRAWDAPGRLIPLETPNYREIRMVPIESYDKIGEEEMQYLMERSFGNANIVQEILQARIPDRGMNLAKANYRRLEVDVFRAWQSGTVIVRNPQDASKTYTASFGFDSARYQTAGTAWNDGSVNAWNLLIGFLEDAEDAIGPLGGVLTRSNVLDAILADAPELAGGAMMTRAQVNEELSQRMGTAIELRRMENSVKIFDDGGITKTSTKILDAGKLMAFPADGRVGYSGFAPVVRAQELSQQVPQAGIDVNGVTVFHFEENHGKELTIEAQLNAFPVPDEQLMYVVNTGIA